MLFFRHLDFQPEQHLFFCLWLLCPFQCHSLQSNSKTENMLQCDAFPRRSHCSIGLRFHKSEIISCSKLFEKVDNAIYRVNHYPVDSAVCSVITYPLDSDLSGGQCYPAFEQLEPGVVQVKILHLTLGEIQSSTLSQFIRFTDWTDFHEKFFVKFHHDIPGIITNKSVSGNLDI